MSNTPILKLPELASGQDNADVTVNQALRQIEATLSRVLSRTNGGPPGSFSDGDSYIVDSATGDWSGFAVDDVTFVVGGAWFAITPIEGWGPLWVNDEDTEVRFDGSSWTVIGGSGAPVDSVFGRIGDVTAQSGDYTFSQIGGSIGETQVPESAVTQHEGALSVTLSQVTDSGAAAGKGVTGADGDAVTGTPGTSGNVPEWNSDGDIVDSGKAASDIGTGSGSVSGPGSSTDNALARYDGTGGGALQNSGVLVDDDDNLFGHGQKIDFKTSDFTLAAADAGKNLDVAKGSAATVTVPSNSNVTLPVGYSVGIVQADGNAVTVGGQSGVTIQSKGGLTSTNGQWSAATLYKRATDEWVLVGDLA